VNSNIETFVIFGIETFVGVFCIAKFEHFMHDFSLVMCNDLLSFNSHQAFN
jgi:isochorismate hydrolase